MRVARGLDVELSIYLEGLPGPQYGSRENPSKEIVGGFGMAKRLGQTPVVVVEGPDAEEAARLMRVELSREPRRPQLEAPGTKAMDDWCRKHLNVDTRIKRRPWS